VHRAMSPQPSRVRMEEGWTEQHEQAFPLTSADLLMEEFDKQNYAGANPPRNSQPETHADDERRAGYTGGLIGCMNLPMAC
jgi:hypothetical protein